MSASASTEHEASRPPSPPGMVPASVVWLPFLMAVVALGGSLWLSVGMGLRACPLCFYQRTFVMGVVAVLGIGFLTGEQHRGALNVLALPLVVAGTGVALFHVYLELNGKLECPAGVMGLGTAPQQGLAALALLLAAVVIGLARSGIGGGAGWLASAGALILGLLLSLASLLSTPPMPPVPTKAYTTPLVMCRPPFHPQ